MQLSGCLLGAKEQQESTRRAQNSAKAKHVTLTYNNPKHALLLMFDFYNLSPRP